jgi:hypothetical protein
MIRSILRLNVGTPPANSLDNLNDLELHQHAFNALSTAAWHIARGEHAKALARIRRAEAHIKASCHQQGAPA